MTGREDKEPQNDKEELNKATSDERTLARGLVPAQNPQETGRPKKPGDKSTRFR